MGIVLFLQVVCHCDTIQSFSLHDAVIVAIDHNPRDVPLIRASEKISICNYRLTRSTFSTVNASSQIGFFLSKGNNSLLDSTLDSTDSPRNLSARNFSAGLTGGYQGKISLLTGGVILGSIKFPFTYSNAPINPSSSKDFSPLPLSCSIGITQPLSISSIKLQRLALRIEKDTPRLIKATSRQSLENFIMQVSNKYYEYLSAQNQLYRTKQSLEQCKLDAEIGQLKYNSGAISRTELAELDAVREEADLQLISISTSVYTKKMDLEDLLGIKLDSAFKLTGMDEKYLQLSTRNLILVRALKNNENLRTLKNNVSSAELRNSFSSIFTPEIKVNYEIDRDFSKNKNAYGASTQSVSAVLDVPLISIRDGSISMKKAEAEKMQAQILYEKEYQRTERSVDDLYRLVTDLKIRIAAANKSVDASRLSLALAREKFMGGSISRATLDLYISKLENNEKQLDDAIASSVLTHLSILQIEGTLSQFFGIYEVEK